MVKDASTRRRSPVDVFRYHDQGLPLRPSIRQKRKGFSYRAFSRAAGLGAPNYLKLVIDGQRKLTPHMAQRFAEACGLSGDAADYFQRLVEFNQASGIEQKSAGFASISGFDRYRRAHRLELAHAAYHSTWYLPAIRELVTSPRFSEDPEWIASQLWPAIKPVEAKFALDTLLELGLVERDAEGRLCQTAAVVSTGPETFGMHIKNYHAEMMRRATQSKELVPAAQRDISSLTFCVGPDAAARIKKRIQEFRRELIALVEAESDRGQVLQLNLQLFPLSLPVSKATAPQLSKSAKKARLTLKRLPEDDK